MARPKTRFVTHVDIMGKDGKKKGHLEFTSGNVLYYRPNAKDVTLRVTYQELSAMMENVAETAEIHTSKYSLPEPHNDGCDFSVTVIEAESDDVDNVDKWPIIERMASWKKLDESRIGIERGTYQFFSGFFKRKRGDKYEWFVHVSVQGALRDGPQFLDTSLGDYLPLQ
jgi:hypothetical protein